jgi:hypothetical protein
VLPIENGARLHNMGGRVAEIKERMPVGVEKDYCRHRGGGKEEECKEKCPPSFQEFLPLRHVRETVILDQFHEMVEVAGSVFRDHRVVTMRKYVFAFVTDRAYIVNGTLRRKIRRFPPGLKHNNMGN